jgi:hypothetical protein
MSQWYDTIEIGVHSCRWTRESSDAWLGQILEEFYKGGEGSLSKLIFFCQVCLRPLHCMALSKAIAEPEGVQSPDFSRL